MFAVPGWSLSPALLKKQVEQEGEGASSSASKKRKRKSAETAEVTSDNLNSLYQQHIEKVKPSKQKKASDGDENAAKSSKPGKRASAADEQAHEKSQVIKSQKAEFRKAKREAQSGAGREKKLVVGETGGGEGNLEKKKKKKKKQKTAHDDKHNEADPLQNVADDPVAESSPVLPPAAAKLTPMQAAMRQKLIGARFRHLNQTLYTSPSGDASKLFDDNPSFFEEYHAGFRSQVESWPENPIDSFVHEIQDRVKVKGSQGKGKKNNSGEATASHVNAHVMSLPTTNGTCKIADLGCGDAALASKVSKLRLNVQVLSYDLSKPNKFVTKADIANLPLPNDGINVAIFCLALMGTNWIDFVEEAWRVLHWKGELWVAEIKSRFGKVQNKRVDHSVGHKQKKRPSKQDLQKQKDRDSNLDNEQLAHEVDEVPLNNEGTDVSGFVEVLRRRGFALQDDAAVDLSNKMFVRMRFVKALPPSKGKNVKADAAQGGAHPKKKMFIEKAKDELDEPGVLKPCLYKIR